MHRHLTPAEETESVLLGDDLEHTLREGPLQLILREEKHTDTVVALVTQLDALRECHLLKEAVADLQEDADAVADLAARVLTSAVLELFHDVQCIVQDARILVAVDVHDAADSAGILGELIHVLEGLGTPECVVSPVLLWHSKGALILISIHIYSTNFWYEEIGQGGDSSLSSKYRTQCCVRDALVRTSSDRSSRTQRWNLFFECAIMSPHCSDFFCRKVLFRRI